MKGMGKFLGRTPHLVTARMGMSKKSNDPEFDDYSHNFTIIEDATDKLYKDAKTFSKSVIELLNAGGKYAETFSNLFHPLVGEYDLIGKHPEARDTIKNVDNYSQVMQQLKDTVSPELELIQSRVIAPIKDFQGVLKSVRKSITKRDHKLVDYDRYNNSLTKLRDKKEKSLSDEKNLFKLEQDFEMASTEYDQINMAMKTEIPQFMVLATQFIDPLFHSFFYMQLNIYYMMKEALEAFAEGNYEFGGTGAAITASYESRRTDAWQEIEELNISKRVVSTAKMMATREGGSRLSPSSASVGRSDTVSSRRSASASSDRSVPPPSPTSRTSALKKTPPPPPPSSSGAVLAKKKPPPPPPSATAVDRAPPPYSAGPTGSASVAAAAKRPPPPPPPLKPKPKPAPPPVQYVQAMYDFAAQAEGDLDFKTGDRIEVVQRTTNTEDWWTGKLNGRQGIFPGNYVQEV